MIWLDYIEIYHCNFLINLLLQKVLFLIPVPLPDKFFVQASYNKVRKL